MKNTNFKRVEHTHGDQRTEHVVVHQKKRHGHWKLKILSGVLAFLVWLIMANIDAREADAAKDDQAELHFDQPSMEYCAL